MASVLEVTSIIIGFLFIELAPSKYVLEQLDETGKLKTEINEGFLAMNGFNSSIVLLSI